MQEQFNMSKRKKYLEGHQYSISKGIDGKWRTYLLDEKKGRRQVKRSTQEAIENVVISFYEKLEQRQTVTFKKMYYKWREFQDHMVGENTTCKYDSEYIRYFKNTKFEKMPIVEITEESIKVFICSVVKEKKLNKGAAKTMFGYINNTIRSARINKVIIDNPMEFLEAKQFYKYCTATVRKTEKKIVSDEEMKRLYEQFQKDYAKQPHYLPTYAVELATRTGFRVGELSALKWECIMQNHILVDKSEKYNRKTKTYYIDKTKNGKERKFPMIKEIKDLLDRVKRVQLQQGYISEWVFADKAGRIHAPIISSCTKNKCRQIGITEKGIHAYRRTVNSKMRCNGVSNVVAAELLGHSKEVNDQYYTFDVTSIKDKANIVSQIHYNIVSNHG